MYWIETFSLYQELTFVDMLSIAHSLTDCNWEDLSHARAVARGSKELKLVETNNVKIGIEMKCMSVITTSGSSKGDCSKSSDSRIVK